MELEILVALILSPFYFVIVGVVVLYFVDACRKQLEK